MAKGFTNFFHKIVRPDNEEQAVSKGIISVDPDTNQPMKAWQRIGKQIKVKNKQPMDGHTPVSEDKLRFVCISDTHTRIEESVNFRIPDGDVLLHAGDFTNSGNTREVFAFNKFIGQFPHRHKIVIAGNHDMCMDDDYVAHINRLHKNGTKVQDYLTAKYGVGHPKDLLSNCVYLLDEMVEAAGIKIYGAPWQPSFGTWGFQLDRGRELLEKWNLIPDDVDILMTHGPPLGMGDRLNSGRHVGCVDLLNTVLLRVKPKFHVFGHIHEGYGMCTAGSTTFINASTVTIKYRPINSPIVFDIDLPLGKTKEDPLVFPLESSSELCPLETKL